MGLLRGIDSDSQGRDVEGRCVYRGRLCRWVTVGYSTGCLKCRGMWWSRVKQVACFRILAVVHGGVVSSLGNGCLRCWVAPGGV